MVHCSTNNTLIISDGNFNNPSIEKVYHIDLDNETDIEIVRRYIYEEEKLGSLQGNDIAVLYGQGSVSVHKSEDFSNYRESRGEYERKQGERNLGKDSGLQYGKRSNSETKTKYSISEEVPDEGAFFSTTDNQGRQLTKEQQEYFKNSKVRDKNGSLLTVYHGTDSEFTVFG